MSLLFATQFAAELELEQERRALLAKESISYFCYPNDIQGISNSGKRAVVLISRGYSSIVVDPNQDFTGRKIAIGWFRSKECSATIWKIESFSRFPGQSKTTRMFNCTYERTIEWK